MTLIEVAFSLPLVVLALGMFVSMLTAGTELRAENRQRATASFAAMEVLELMRNRDLASLVAHYNADPWDDPGGPGTSPGETFRVDGLDELDGTPNGEVGRVRLPLVNTGTEVAPVWELREDVQMPALGMPRDLNGDSIVDGLDHRADFTVLPVQLEIVWRGSRGARRYAVDTLLTKVGS